MMSDFQEMLTTQQFAERAGVSKNTVSKWLRDGKIHGSKIGGKWKISTGELDKGAAPTNPIPDQTPDSATNIKTGKSTSAEAKAKNHYSLDEFSAMTYLTAYGVEQWLKTGRLKGVRDETGHWRIDGANLMNTDLQRLLRQ